MKICIYDIIIFSSALWIILVVSFVQLFLLLVGFGVLVGFFFQTGGSRRELGYIFILFLPFTGTEILVTVSALINLPLSSLH